MKSSDVKPPPTDISTVHIIVKGAILVALFCLLAGVFLAIIGYREGAIALLGAPTGCISGLFALLARTSTLPPPTVTGSPPAVAAAATQSTSSPAPDQEAAPGEAPANPPVNPSLGETP